MIPISSNVFGDPSLGDPIAPLSAIGFALWLGFTALFFGGLAFALAPLLGRAGAAGAAGIAFAVLWTVNGLNIGPLAVLSPFRWTRPHPAHRAVRLAGPGPRRGRGGGVPRHRRRPVSRRDLGVTLGVGLPQPPALVLGVRGPTSRAFRRPASPGAVVGPRARDHGRPAGVTRRPDVGPAGRGRQPPPSTADGLPGLRPRWPVASSRCSWRSSTSRPDSPPRRSSPVGVRRDRRAARGGARDAVVPDALARRGGRRGVSRRRSRDALFALGVTVGAAAGGITAGTALLGSAALGLYAARGDWRRRRGRRRMADLAGGRGRRRPCRRDVPG